MRPARGGRRAGKRPQSLAATAWLILLLSEPGVAAQAGHLAADPTRGGPPDVLSQVFNWLKSMQTPPKEQAPASNPQVGPAAQPAPVKHDAPVTPILSEASWVRVPALRGETPARARQTLAQTGLRLGAGQAVNSNTKTGLILSTQPAAGTIVRRGSEIGYSLASHEAAVETPLESPLPPSPWAWPRGRISPLAWAIAIVIAAGALTRWLARPRPTPKPPTGPGPSTASLVVSLPGAAARVTRAPLSGPRLAVRLDWRIERASAHVRGLPPGSVRRIRRENAA
jgi:hypothetical protein